ncbi:MAG: glycine dehydrogenase [Acidimicrobiales bacterium]
MTSFVPHTAGEVKAMLDDLGHAFIDDLFGHLPADLLLEGDLDLAVGRSEADVVDRARELAGANRPVGSDLVCFAGGGAYDHDIPAVVAALAGRSEFVTAYTPYQAEVSQGVLQALFEFQSLLCRLTGMDVANASLYDGATALVEAVNLAAATGRDQIWVSDGVAPRYRQVLATFAAGTGHQIVPVGLVDGLTDWDGVGRAFGSSAVGAGETGAGETGAGETGAGPPVGTAAGDEAVGVARPPAAVVLAYPNFLGCIEEVADAAAVAKERGALLIVVFDPVAAGLLPTPGELGADVVVGEGQPFGMPLGMGGPYLGLFACRSEHVRRLPGRLVGQTVDAAGRRAYVSTLRTREQDIRREKASSNVCTNQTLMAVAFTVHLAWLGTEGLAELARACARGAHYARSRLLAIDGVEPLASAAVFREFALRVPGRSAEVVGRLAEEGFLVGPAWPGGPLSPAAGSPGGRGHRADWEDEEALLISVTEKRTRAEIDGLVEAMGRVLR